MSRGTPPAVHTLIDRSYSHETARARVVAYRLLRGRHAETSWTATIVRLQDGVPMHFTYEVVGPNARSAAMRLVRRALAGAAR